MGDAVGVAEGDSGEPNLVFTVSLSTQADDNVTVDYITGDDTATLADDDYVFVAGTLVIPAGQLQGTVAVPVRGDDNAENDEALLLRLSNPSGNAQIVDGVAKGAIVNDDGDAICNLSGIFEWR